MDGTRSRASIASKGNRMQALGDGNGERLSPAVTLTAADFCQRMAVSQRAGPIGLLLWLGGLFTFFAIAGLVGSQFGPLYTLNKGYRILAVGILFGGTFSIILGMAFWLDRFEKRLGLACIRCRQSLSGIDGYLAIATRRCPHCLEIVLAGAETSNRFDQGMNVPVPGSCDYSWSDIEAADKAERLAFGRSMLRWFVMAIVASGLASLGLFCFESEIATTFGDFANDISKPLRIVPALVVVGVGVIVARRRSIRLCALQCRACGIQLHKNNIMRLTGNCLDCGCRVLRDPQAPYCEDSTESEGLLDRNEFTPNVRRLRKAGPMCCLYGGLAAVAWLGLIWAVLRWNGIPLRGPVTNPWVIVAGVFTSVIQIGTVFWTNHRWQRRLCCPHCNQSLLVLTHIVHATGNCCHCGRRVLTSPSKQHAEATRS